MTEMEDPHGLLRRLKLGREEYCQRLLTMLVLGGAYPRWNTRSTPSERGLEFLRALDELSFGEPSPIDQDAVFIDEFDLAARPEGETGRAPDYAVFTGGRIWLIELKTERGSHDPAQLPAYVELSTHHYPGLSLDVTYLTPPLPGVHVHEDERARIAHVTWEEVLPLVRQVWGEAAGRASDIVTALDEALSSIGSPWTGWRRQVLDDVVELALRTARQTGRDGEQRGFEYHATSMEELQQLRVEVRDRLGAGGQPDDGLVTPWLWNAHTTDGRPLTQAGSELGYELRFSRARNTDGAEGS